MTLITVDWLLSRCVRNDCGCLVWTRYVYDDGNGRDAPMARPTKDDKPMHVRRLVWKAMTGKAPSRNEFISRICATWGCVEPACLVCRRRNETLVGRKLDMGHRAKIARTHQKKRADVLTVEAARAIRAAATTNGQEAALRGVSETTIAEIRRGNRWRDYSNPFAQLAA